MYQVQFNLLLKLSTEFKFGFLFFYFSSLDQNQHMMWRCFDPNHPLYDPNFSPTAKNSVRDFYIRMDLALGQTMEHVDSNTLLMIMSDHGFKPLLS